MLLLVGHVPAPLPALLGLVGLRLVGLARVPVGLVSLVRGPGLLARVVLAVSRCWGLPRDVRVRGE